MNDWRYYNLADRVNWYEHRFTRPEAPEPPPVRLHVDHDEDDDWEAFLSFEPLPWAADPDRSTRVDMGYWNRFNPLTPLDADPKGKTIPTKRAVYDRRKRTCALPPEHPVTRRRLELRKARLKKNAKVVYDPEKLAREALAEIERPTWASQRNRADAEFEAAMEAKRKSGLYRTAHEAALALCKEKGWL